MEGESNMADGGSVGYTYPGVIGAARGPGPRRGGGQLPPRAPDKRLGTAPRQTGPWQANGWPRCCPPPPNITLSAILFNCPWSDLAAQIDETVVVKEYV